PRTEEQLAERDYLEAAGRTVPDSLIKLPEPKAQPSDTSGASAPLPTLPQAAVMGAAALGQLPAAQDSLRLGPRYQSSGLHMPPSAGGTAAGAAGAGGAAAFGPAPTPHDSTARDTSFTHASAPPDTTHAPAPPDTTHKSKHGKR